MFRGRLCGRQEREEESRSDMFFKLRCWWRTLPNTDAKSAATTTAAHFFRNYFKLEEEVNDEVDKDKRRRRTRYRRLTSFL